MTKKIDIAIDKYQAKTFLNSVRTKQDVIIIWMNAIKTFIDGLEAKNEQISAHLSLVVMSMSRLFCVLPDGLKIFSIAFPFSVRSEGDEYAFYSRGGVKIDNITSSQIIALIQSQRVFEKIDALEFIDPIIETSSINKEIWNLLQELMLAEDGYLRYDWDKARENGHKHPEHHLDLYYSSGSSFKIGLTAPINKDALTSILNTETECHYLAPAEKIKK